MSPTDDTSQYVPPLHARRLKVFLCHARGDREEVEDLYGRLDNQGVQPWLDKRDIYASSGSACTSRSSEPSHVLVAMGVPRPALFGALRVTFGHDNAPADVDSLLEAIPMLVARARPVAV